LLASEGLALPGAVDRPMPRAGLAAWCESGGAALTGWPDERPALPRHDIFAGALDVAGLVGADAAAELFSRGFSRRGRTSANGTCRLLRTRDGWVAINLARDSDVASVPAIVERDDVNVDDVADAWRALESFAGSRTRAATLSRVHLLDVAGAALAEPAGPPFVIERMGDASAAPIVRPRVVDLSALWAGPLCARLLRDDGAHVVTVDSAGRPSTRRDGDEHVTVDFSSREFRDVLASADVVIESARPRALRQFGIDASSFVAARPGVSWITITAYGRCSARVGFGDDAAVAGGVVADDDRGEPVFCGDAIADPLTGMYAAAAGRAALHNGGGVHISLALRDVAAHAAAVGGPLPR
jgi:crotonobetainyl-CoA:carnitine CoA-transferase CaiB-like acyl-CoA transferase